MRAVWQTVTRLTTNIKTASFTATLLASLLLPALANPNIVHATGGINNTRGDAWGTLEVAGSGWLNGGGVDIYSNGSQVSYNPNKPNNTVNGVVSGEEWQCVELVNRLYLTKGWTTANWPGNGGQLYDNAPGNLTKQANGAISSITPGDTLVLQDTGAGHAAIINTYNSSTGAIQIASQNTNAVYDSTSFSYSNGTISKAVGSWSGYQVKGIVHIPTTHWIPLAGDWTGKGYKSIGLYNPNTATFYLRNSNTPGNADIITVWGSGGNWVPLVGDWNNDGIDTIGVYNPNLAKFYLSNSNTSPEADYTTVWGSGGNWVPLAGDWDNYLGSTIGVYNPNLAKFYLSNYITNPEADYTTVWGSGGNWVPLAGNWDGYLSTTIGLYNPSTATFYLSNYNTNPEADYTVAFGNGGTWEPVVGDWDGNGTTTIGIYDHAGSTFYLSNSNTSGIADITVPYGNPN